LTPVFDTTNKNHSFTINVDKSTSQQDVKFNVWVYINRCNDKNKSDAKVPVEGGFALDVTQLNGLKVNNGGLDNLNTQSSNLTFKYTLTVS